MPADQPRLLLEVAGGQQDHREWLRTRVREDGLHGRVVDNGPSPDYA